MKLKNMENVRCPVCHADTLTFKETLGQFDIYTCDNPNDNCILSEIKVIHGWLYPYKIQVNPDPYGNLP